ncbi:MAG: hypothetical protein ACR2M0_03380 [Chloroflexia bacterium]
MSKLWVWRVAFGGAVLIFVLNLGIHVATFVIRPVTAEFVLALLSLWILIGLLMVANVFLALLAMPLHWRERDRKRKLRARLLLTDAPTPVRLICVLGMLLIVYGSFVAYLPAISALRSTPGEQLVASGLEPQLLFVRGLSAFDMAFFLLQAVDIAEWLGLWHRRGTSLASGYASGGRPPEDLASR